MNKGLALALGTLAVLTGCSEQGEPKPYRGELIRTLEIDPVLAAKFDDQIVAEGGAGFDPAKNCVQMIGRDRTVDGIRKVKKLVIFSPDPCPEDGSVAAREAFALEYHNARGAGTGRLPMVVIALQFPDRPATSELVGDVSITALAPLAPASPSAASPYPYPPGSPGSVPTPAPKMVKVGPDSYELSDLCSLKARHNQNCKIEFSEEGTFVDIDDTSATGRAARESDTITRLLTKMDSVSQEVIRNVHAAEKRLFEDLVTHTDGLKNAILNHQMEKSRLVLGRLAEMTEELTNNEKLQLHNLYDQLRKDVAQAQKEINAETKKQVEASTNAVNAKIKTAQETIDRVETSIINPTDGVKKSITDLKAAVGKVADNQTTLNTSVGTLSTNLTTLSTGVSGLTTKVTALEEAAALQKISNEAKTKELVQLRADLDAMRLNVGRHNSNVLNAILALQAAEDQQRRARDLVLRTKTTELLSKATVGIRTLGLVDPAQAARTKFLVDLATYSPDVALDLQVKMLQSMRRSLIELERVAGAGETRDSIAAARIAVRAYSAHLIGELQFQAQILAQSPEVMNTVLAQLPTPLGGAPLLNMVPAQLMVNATADAKMQQLKQRLIDLKPLLSEQTSMSFLEAFRGLK